MLLSAFDNAFAHLFGQQRLSALQRVNFWKQKKPLCKYDKHTAATTFQFNLCRKLHEQAQ